MNKITSFQELKSVNRYLIQPFLIISSAKIGYAKKTEKPKKKPVYIAPIEPSGEDIELLAVLCPPHL